MAAWLTILFCIGVINTNQVSHVMGVPNQVAPETLKHTELKDLIQKQKLQIETNQLHILVH